MFYEAPHRKLLLAGLFVSATAAGVVAWRTSHHSPNVIAMTRSSQELSQDAERMAPAYALQRQARQAEAAGDLALAEQLYNRCSGISASFATFPLAQLHDKMGKYKLAIAGYKKLFSFAGSPEDDACLLTRCADLDMLYGSKVDARTEYLAAAKRPSMYEDKTLAPVAAGEDLSKTAPIEVIRACAYYNAGTFWRFQGGPKGAKYLELALSLEPKSALMRFGYSFAVPGNAQAQDWLAEQEATGPLKAALHKWRAQGNELGASTKLFFVNGVAHQTVTPYAPKGPIFTPHIPDPIKTGNPRWSEGGSATPPVP